MLARWKHHVVVRRLITLGAVFASAFLQAYAIQVFVRPANLLSGGFTGVAILFDAIAGVYGRSFSISLGMLVLNIPVALLCCKSISTWFTFFSLLQVFLASFFLEVFHMECVLLWLCGEMPPLAAQILSLFLSPTRQGVPYGNMCLWEM